MAMRREHTQATEATGGAADKVLTERWYELRNMVDSLRAQEARCAELAMRLAKTSPRPTRD